MSTQQPEKPSAALLSANPLRRRYLVALSLIALLTVVSQAVIQVVIADQRYDSRVVNIAGRQRMLSQKIAKLSLYVAGAGSPEEASVFRAQLEETVSLWQQSHRGLIDGSPELELPGRNSAEVVALFASIEEDHRAIVDATSALLASPASAAVLDRELVRIRRHEPSFLSGMDEIVSRYELEAERRIAFARGLEVTLLAVTLLVLLLEAIFIFAPAARRIRRDMEALSGKEEDLVRLFEASPTAMLLVEARDLSIRKASRKAIALFGISPDALPGDLTQLIDVRDEGGRLLLEKIGETDALDEHELIVFGAGGAALSALVSVRRTSFGGGAVFVLGVTDITERKLVEAELAISATAFEAQEGMFITNAASEILRVNLAFTAITGYSAEEAVGKTPSLIKSGRHDAAFYRDMHESIARSGSWRGEIWNRRKSGETFPEWLTITAVKSSKGKLTHYVATLTDITVRKAAEHEIQHLAFYDALTHLPNRRLLLERLVQALSDVARSLREGALLFIDLDHFKTLNDTLGHDKGDLLLQQVATRLSACVREGDTVARLGGDEFVVMLENLSASPAEAPEQARAIGEKILHALNQPYQLSGHEYHITPSIGVTLFAEHDTSIEELMKRADLAMYEAKTAGRNALRFYDPQMQAVVSTRAFLEAGLREALRGDQFRLYYQPQVNLSGLVTGVEALVRWQHPQRGVVSPAEFIPAAEACGLILPLGAWVLENACVQLARWAEHPATARLTIAVNVSARQFRQANFVEQVLEVLERTGARPKHLKLELTESMVLSDVEELIVKMGALKARGVGFSLDDFGTGYSSLSCLKRLPLDQLKIDQSFVRDILTNSNDAVISRTIVLLARSLGLSVIAEGVETEGQRDALFEQGCYAFQGYLFGRPVPASSLEAMLEHSDPPGAREQTALA